MRPIGVRGVTAGGFFRALAFLTRLPVPKRFVERAGEGKALPLETFWFPAVGAVIGSLLALSSSLLKEIPSFSLPAHAFLLAFLILLFWIFLTGGLHLDGIADTMECALAEVPPEDKRRIRKDPRKGVYAIVALNLALLAKWIGLVSVSSVLVPLFLAPFLSRAALPGVFLFLARSGGQKGDGLGGLLLPGGASGIPGIGVLAGPVLAIGAAGLSGGGRGALEAILSVLAMAVLGRAVLGRIDSLSGDLAGLLIESGEIFFLLAAGFQH